MYLSYKSRIESLKEDNEEYVKIEENEKGVKITIDIESMNADVSITAKEDKFIKINDILPFYVGWQAKVILK